MNEIKRKLNLVKTAVTNPVTFTKKLIYGSQQLPFSFRQMLDKIGNEQITSLTIIRQPLSHAIFTLMNAFQGFQLAQKLKESQYDTLFHLKIRINNKYDLEKEEVVQLRMIQNTGDQEIVQIDQIPSITISEFVERTIKHMSIKRFVAYNGSNNNCQVFIINLLHANGINNPTYDNFIKQDTTFVFQNNPKFRKFLNTVTEIGRAKVQLEEGTGFKKLNTTTNNQIVSLCIKLNIKLIKICMKDELKAPLQQGNYIINLQNHDQPGTHWVSFRKYKNYVFYNDSFGVVPPQNEYDIFKNEGNLVYYNTHQHQDLNANSCGYWCIYFLYAMEHNKGSMLQRFKSFNKLFSNDTKNNEKILLQKINTITK